MHIKIKRFAKAMETEIHANRHKGDWQQWDDISDMLNDLEYHKAKLLFAIKESDKDKVKEYIADCANILMCIGNVGGLYNQ